MKFHAIAYNHKAYHYRFSFVIAYHNIAYTIIKTWFLMFCFEEVMFTLQISGKLSFLNILIGFFLTPLYAEVVFSIA